jgi:hypothetical protein
MLQRLTLSIIICLCSILFSCKKEKLSVLPPVTSPKVSGALYNDSVFYVQNANDYFVNPVIVKKGTFSGFPDGLDIDQNTGVINVNKSETGLKYKVSFVPADGADIISSSIIISGINYTDKIYNLSLNDSIAAPVYNANKSLAIPGANGNIFDASGGCKKVGITVDPNNGIINLAKTIRNQGIDTGSTAEVKLVYKINDNSHGAPNGINVKIYFYRTANEVPQYLKDLLIERKTTILASYSIVGPITRSRWLNGLTLRAAAPARPRPPCIVVISR